MGNLERLTGLRDLFLATPKDAEIKKAFLNAVINFTPTFQQVKTLVETPIDAGGFMLSRNLPMHDGIIEVAVGHILSTYSDLVGVGSLDTGWDEECAVVQEFCRVNDVFYYARPKETFSASEAIGLAKEAGKKIVVTENLS